LLKSRTPRQFSSDGTLKPRNFSEQRSHPAFLWHDLRPLVTYT
jgi:hypothetical protein